MGKPRATIRNYKVGTALNKMGKLVYGLTYRVTLRKILIKSGNGYFSIKKD